MQAVNKTLLKWNQVAAAPLAQPASVRTFGVTYGDVVRQDQMLKRKLSALKMFTKDKEFKYEPP